MALRVHLSVLALVLGGCVRAGFEPSGEAPFDQGAVELGWPAGESGVRELSLPPWDVTGPSSDLPKGPTHKISGANDVCATAAQVSLKTLPVTLHIDVSGAKLDYQPDCCGAGQPDVVVHLTDVPANMSLECTGGGSVYFRRSSTGCPPQTSLCLPKSCDGSGYNKTTSSSSEYDWVLCRDPADKPATLVFLPDP